MNWRSDRSMRGSIPSSRRGRYYSRGLDKRPDGSKIPKISGNNRYRTALAMRAPPSGFMKPTTAAKTSAEKDHESV
jgi:hypothetical protein